MLEREANGTGWQVTLRARGGVRFLFASFLCVWLCGWAVGEGLTLALLGGALRGVFGRGFLAGLLPELHGATPSGGALPLLIAFLAVWLPLWTIGGLGALSRLLSLLFGREAVRWSAEALEVERWPLFPAGAFRIEPRRITGLRLRGRQLVADTRARAVTVAQLGSEAERAELHGVLEEWRKGFNAVPELSPEESPVPDHVVIRDETGAPALTPTPRTYRIVGFALFTFGLGLVGALTAVAARGFGPVVMVACLVLGLPALLCGLAGIWLLAVRESWHPRPGVLERRRTGFGRTWTRRFEPLGLELRADTGSDGDARWKLVATGGGKDELLVTALRDPNVPLSLGEWLAARTGVELVQKDREPEVRKAG